MPNQAYCHGNQWAFGLVGEHLHSICESKGSHLHKNIVELITVLPQLFHN